MSASWQLTLPCTRAEAEAIAGLDLDLPAVLMTSEVGADAWRLDAFFDGQPSAATVAAVRELAASAGWSEAAPAPVPDQDWVALSQAGLPPIREGRFIVHTDAHPVTAGPGERALLIPAAQAFGTGHHATTAGCLAMLDGLAGRAVANAVDLGTGTGLLAFAVAHLWPGARVLATDIDPVAVAAARENAGLNGVAGVELLVADGTRDPAIQAGAPFDLVVANILAGPLVALAPEVAAVTAPGAALVLAGLLGMQAGQVVAAYEAQGCLLAERVNRGEWAILRLTAGAAPAAVAPPAGDRDGWAHDR